MAVTKTHPIKTTLNKAIAYICNPGKTDDTILVSAFGCSAETADIEFSWTRRHAIDKGTNLGRHLIQAFSPGEITPEQAHEIGTKMAVLEVVRLRLIFTWFSPKGREDISPCSWQKSRRVKAQLYF